MPTVMLAAHLLNKVKSGLEPGRIAYFILNRQSRS